MRRIAVWSAVLCVAAGALPAAVTAAGRGRAAVRKPQGRPAAAVPAVRAAPTEEVARLQAAMLSDLYQELLRETHKLYPTRPGRPVAATVVRQVQERMRRAGHPESRFLAVNAVLMNPDHRARDSFEREAARRLASGEESVELVEQGEGRGAARYYRAAMVVPLGSGCGSCHWSQGGLGARAAIAWNVKLAPEPAGQGSR